VGFSCSRLSQVNWFGFHVYWGRRNNLGSILLISPVADLSDSVSFFKMQKCNLQLPLRVQECSPLTPQDAGVILLSRGDGIPIHLP
jgi:hypothetical protein